MGFGVERVADDNGEMKMNPTKIRNGMLKVGAIAIAIIVFGYALDAFGTRWCVSVASLIAFLIAIPYIPKFFKWLGIIIPKFFKWLWIIIPKFFKWLGIAVCVGLL